MTTQSTTEFSKTGSFITPGLVISYAGGTSPAGWLLCQGQAVLRSAYPQLFNAIGTTYNTQFNPTSGGYWPDPGISYFRVPDYRGLSMRGVGTPSGLDTVTLGGYQNHMTAPNGLSTSSEGGHDHVLNNGAFRFESGGVVGSPDGSLNDGDPQIHIYRSTDLTGNYTNIPNRIPPATNYSGGHGHGLSGDNETRPISKGVYFIIKY